MILFASSPERFVTVKCATGLSATVFFRIDGNLGNLYCYSCWRVAIDNYNASFLSLATVSHPKYLARLHYSYQNVNPWRVVFLVPSTLATPLVLSWQCRGL
jgi:hypothetical protein